MDTRLNTTFFKPPAQRSIRRVHEKLIALFGEATPQVLDPLDGLVLILLSQATNDINCDRAFRSLKQRYPTWAEVLTAPVPDIADAIRTGGLANQKAARISALLREIYDERGDLDLSWMHTATAQQCRDYLSKFHGVGPKTIACVLVFYLNKPAFPVDTHVHRVTKRLGWIRPQASATEAHTVLEAAIPDDCKLVLHVNLISHGRAICRADGNGGPRCGACPLRSDCAYWKGLDRKERRQLLDNEDGTTVPVRIGSDFFVTVESRDKAQQ